MATCDLWEAVSEQRLIWESKLFNSQIFFSQNLQFESDKIFSEFFLPQFTFTLNFDRAAFLFLEYFCLADAIFLLKFLDCVHSNLTEQFSKCTFFDSQQEA